jgi:hypothetical protein
MPSKEQAPHAGRSRRRPRSRGAGGPDAHRTRARACGRASPVHRGRRQAGSRPPRRWQLRRVRARRAARLRAHIRARGRRFRPRRGRGRRGPVAPRSARGQCPGGVHRLPRFAAHPTPDRVEVAKRVHPPSSWSTRPSCSSSGGRSTAPARSRSRSRRPRRPTPASRATAPTSPLPASRPSPFGLGRAQSHWSGDRGAPKPSGAAVGVSLPSGVVANGQIYTAAARGNAISIYDESTRKVNGEKLRVLRRRLGRTSTPGSRQSGLPGRASS